MRYTLTIFRWEMRKIITNWRKTLVVFLLPAILLLAALNVFPMLINYLSTGHLQSRPVTVVAAPQSFRDFIKENDKASFYSITWIESSGSVSSRKVSRKIDDMIRNGQVVLVFEAQIEDEPADFDECIREAYGRVAHRRPLDDLYISVTAFHEEGSYAAYLQAEQIMQDLVKDYQNYIPDVLGDAYHDIGGGDRWVVDEFNPFTFIMENRAYANTGAARTVPAMMILLMYYCVYSLTGEILASSRESGFLTKVYLTPIPETSLLSGKMLTIVSISTISAMLTYVLLFFASWFNRSNSAFSLLPFGLFLTPSQLLYSLITLLFTSCMMTAMCFAIVFKVRRMEDVLMNLQVPLVLLIFEFFALMFRPSMALTVEYLIPIHNSMMLIREIFLGCMRISSFIAVTIVNLAWTALFVAICYRNKDGLIHIAQGGKNDSRQSRLQKIWSK